MLKIFYTFHTCRLATFAAFCGRHERAAELLERRVRERGARFGGPAEAPEHAGGGGHLPNFRSEGACRPASVFAEVGPFPAVIRGGDLCK